MVSLIPSSPELLFCAYCGEYAERLYNEACPRCVEEEYKRLARAEWDYG